MSKTKPPAETAQQTQRARKLATLERDVIRAARRWADPLEDSEGWEADELMDAVSALEDELSKKTNA